MSNTNTLLTAIQRVVNNNNSVMKLTDWVIGTVTRVKPIEVTLSETMLPIPSSMLFLSNGVIEYKIDNLQHIHTATTTATVGTGSTGSVTVQPALNKGTIQVYENNLPLGVTGDDDGNKIIINRKLQVGDKVGLLRVQNGKAFIVWTRLFKEIG